MNRWVVGLRQWGWSAAICIALSCSIGALLAVASFGDQPRDAGAADIAHHPVDVEKLRDASREANARAALRDKSAAVAERSASRVAHRGLSREEAISVARAQNRHLFDQPGFRSLQVPPGRLVKRFVSDHVALIEDQEGEKALLESAVPLRAEDSDGESTPVDLTLRELTQGFVPRNPLVPARISRESTDSSVVGAGRSAISLRPVGRQVVGTRVGETVFYPNIDTDTDFFVRLVPAGVETFHQLRSPASPESLVLRYSLPEGASWRVREDGAGVEVLRGERTIGAVTRPAAWDAQNRPLPITFTVTGDELRLAVPHRDRDIAYPITVDPITLTDSFMWLSQGETSTAGWSVANFSTTGGFGWYFAQNSGLRMHGAGASHYYNPGDRAEWQYDPLGTDSRVFYVKFQDVGIQTPGGMCTYAGVWSRQNNNFEAPTRYYCGNYNEPVIEWSFPGSRNNVPLWGLQVNWGGGWVNPWTSAWLNNVTIGVTDDVQPQIAGSTPGVVLDPATSARYEGWDAGTGVHRIRISSPDDPNWVGYDNMWQCSGTPRWPCPNPAHATFNYSGFPPGEQRKLVIEVWDRVYNYTRREEIVSYYPTSWQYGGPNHMVDTDAELQALWNAVEDEFDYDGREDIRSALSPADRARLDAFFPTSLRYGGSLDTPAERSAVEAELRTEEISNKVWDGLTAADQEVMRPLLEDGTPPPSTAADYDGGPNSAERKYCRNPLKYFRCRLARELADEALTSAVNRFPDDSLHNGRGDAYRHCIWSGHMTLKWDRTQAKKFGDLHEDLPNNPAREKAMDQHNNKFGRDVGDLYDSDGESEEAKEAVRDYCQAVANTDNDDRLWTINEVP